MLITLLWAAQRARARAPVHCKHAGGEAKDRERECTRGGSGSVCGLFWVGIEFETSRDESPRDEAQFTERRRREGRGARGPGRTATENDPRPDSLASASESDVLRLYAGGS